MTTLLESRPKRSVSRARHLAENFFRRLAQSRHARRLEMSRSRPVYMEPLEPRLLLSASLTYSALAAQDLTLKAENSGGQAVLDLYETGTSTSVGSVTLVNPGDETVHIARAGGSTANDVSGDTLRIDLSTFNLAQLDTFVGANTLDLEFELGKDISLFDALHLPVSIGDDQVTFRNSPGSSIGFNMTTHSTSDIQIEGSASATFGGDVTVNSDSKVDMKSGSAFHTGSHDITFKAGNSITKTGDADSADFFQLPSAEIDVTSATLDGHNIKLDAKATENVTINQASKLDGKLNFAEILLIGHSDITLDGATLTASGTAEIDATADMTSTLTKKPKEDSDTTTDAALAVAVIDSEASIQLINSTDITSTGATTIAALNKTNLNSTADGSLGGSNSAGAVLAVSTVLGDTEVTVDSSSVDASKVTISSTTDRTLTTLAKASFQGAKDGDSSTNESQQRLNDPNKDGNSSDHAATSEGSVDFAATVAVSVITGHTWATLDNATITSDSTIDVTASAKHVVSTTADGSTTDSSAPGVGVGVAVGVHILEAKALVEGTTSLTAPTLTGVTITAEMDPASKFDVSAKSGASGSGSGITFAGSLAINVTLANAYATIAPSTSINVHNSDLTLQAKSTTEASATTDAGVAGGGESTGVGASVALTVLDNDTKAKIGGSATLTNSAKVDVAATADHTVKTSATGGSKGGTAITPVVALSVVTLDTDATIESGGAALTTGGDLTVEADGKSDLDTKAEGKASGDTAVGAAIAFTWLEDNVLAQTSRSVTSGGATSFKAKGRSVSKSESKASADGAKGKDEDSSGKSAQDKTDDQRGFANSQAGASGRGASDSGTENKAESKDNNNDSVAVAAAISVNIATTKSQALIPDGVTIDSDGLLTVQSSANTDATATADGNVKDASTGVGAAIAINVAQVTNEAHIGNATITAADGVAVKALMTDVGSETTDKHSLDADATSGSGASDVSVAGSLAINYAKVTTTAQIDGGANITVADGGDLGSGVGPITLEADSVTENTAKALPNPDTDGEGGADSAGIGASIALNLVFDDTTAKITNGATVSGTAGSLSVTATGDHTITTEAKSGAKGSTGIGAAVAIVVAENHTSAYVGTGADLTVGGAATIGVTHKETLKTDVSSEASGSDCAVGASVGVSILDDSATATLARNLSAGGLVQITSDATVSNELTVNATAGGEKKESDGGKSADTQSNNAVNSNDNVTNNGGGHSVPSASSESSGAKSQGSSQSGEDSGGVGVAAAVAVNFVGLKNTAQVTNGADITTTGAVTVSASEEVDASSKAIGLSVTLEDGTRIGAAVGVNVVSVDNKALVQGGSIIHGNGITIEAITTASKKNDFLDWAAAAGGGTGDVGIGGSVAVQVVTFTTEASAASTSQLRSTAGLTVDAEQDMTVQTLAAGAGFSEGTSVGAAVSVSVLTINTDAFINGNADAAGAMNITASTTLAPPPSLTLPKIGAVSIPVSSVALAGGASSGGVGIAGAVVVNVSHINTHAYIGSGAQVNQDGTIVPSGQSITIHATNTTTMNDVAGSLGISTDSVGVGAGLDVNILSKQTDAYIAGGATVSSAGALNVHAESTEHILSVAANAGIGDSVGVAGSASIQVITTDTHAYIGGGATVDGGSVTLTAEGTFTAIMVAGSVGGGSSAGVGAAASVLVHTDHVEAYIGASADVTSDGGGVSLSATSSEDLITIAAAGGFASTAGVAGSAAVNVLNETTQAYVAQSATVTDNSGGGLSLLAQDVTSIVSVAGNLSVGGTAGVGLGADVGVINKTTQAYIDSGVTAHVDGDVSVSAKASEDITSVAAGLSASGTASVALDASVHTFNEKTRAWIGDDPTDGIASAGAGDVHAGGNVSIAADDHTEINAIVGVLAVSGTAGVGAAGNVTVMDKTTEAFIGNGASVTGDGGTSGIDVATGQFSQSFVAGGTFDPGSPGSQGIHADSIGSNPDSSTLKSQGAVKTPTMSTMDVNQDGSSDAQDGGLTGARTLSPTPNSGFHGVSVTATNRDTVRAFTMSIAGGTAGIAISAGVNVINNTTDAYIGDNASVNANQAGADSAQSVNVAAGSDFYFLGVAGTLGVGVVGVSPAVGVTVLTNTTEASIGAGATVKAKNDVTVQSHGAESELIMAFGLAGGVVGIGGAVNVLTVNNTTTASIGGTVSAGGDVFVDATDDTKVTVVSGALAGGFVGIGASVGVMVINKDTEAFIADGATVDAKANGTGISGVLDGGIVADAFTGGVHHGVIVQAQSKEEILNIVIAGGAGFVGVSGAVGVTVIDSNTDAYIGNANVNQTSNGMANLAQDVYVNASNEVRLTSGVGAFAAGFVGVGGAVDVGSLKNDTKAEIHSGAHVAARDDVEVNAVSIEEMHGYTFSGAGGVVGLTASVSVWSIGTPIEKGYSDNDGNSSTATQGDNGSADSDGASQAGSSSSQVGGLLNGYGTGGNPNGSSARVGSATHGASSRLGSAAPSGGSITGAENSATPSNGVVATIAGGSTVNAGGDIDVNANRTEDVTILVGSVAGGLAGVGASIQVLSVAVSASASAGGTLTAGGHIDVNAHIDETVKVTAFGGAIGFVGLGASVVVITDKSTVQAGILDGADILGASSIGITATTDQDIHGHATQATSGAIGAGAAFVKISVDNPSATDTSAYIGSNVDIGQGVGTVGNISVTATSNISAYAQTEALSGGIGAMSANFAFVDVTPEVHGTVGAGSHIRSTGTLSVSATATPFAHASAFGFNVGALAVGASLSDVEASPDVLASAGGTIEANGLTITGRQSVGGSGKTAFAETTGSAGALVGINATISTAEDNGHVNAGVADGSTLTIHGSTDIEAHNNNKQEADATANTIGLIAAGISKANAKSNTVTNAYLGTDAKLTGQSLTIIADGTDNNFADTVAGSAGLVAGASASAETHTTSSTDARIRNRTGGTSRNVDLSGSGSGDLLIKAEHTATINARTRAFAGGLFAGLGASNDNEVNANVTAAIGNFAIVKARDIEIDAFSHLSKPLLSTPNLEGSTGGFISGGGGDSSTHVNFTSLVDVGSGASLSLVGNVGSPGGFVLKAMNFFDAHDKNAFTAGGAFAGLDANSYILVDTDLSRVHIGSGATLTSIGQIDIFARGTGSITAATEAQAFGLATFIAADAQAQVHPHNEIEVDSGAMIHAKRDLNLYAGTDSNFLWDNYSEDARSDTFAGSAIPIGDVNSTTAKVTYNTITIHSGATLETAGEARLQAERDGLASLTGSAKAVSWVSAVQDFLNGAAAAQMNDRTIIQEAHGVIQMDGTVRTGIERNKLLELNDSSTTAITSFTDQGDITFSSSLQPVNSALASQLQEDKNQLNTYGASNPTLKTFYEGEITRLEGLMVAAGEFEFRAIGITTGALGSGDAVVYHADSGPAIGPLVDGQTYYIHKVGANTFALQNTYTGSPDDDLIIDPTGAGFNHHLTKGGTDYAFTTGDLKGISVAQSALTVTVDPMTAQAGRIDVRTDMLQGGGTFDAPGDASVRILNHTAAFLVINGIIIPDQNGGLFLNGDPVTTNAEINTSNVNAAAFDNQRTGPGDTNPFVPGTAAFGPLPNTAGSPMPFIRVVNDFVAGHISPSVNVPWPDITVLGEIRNLGGLVHLETLAAGQGNITIKAPVTAATLEILAGGTVNIDLSNVPNSRFNVGPEPFTTWASITQGEVPGDPAHVSYGGLSSATDVNKDGIDEGDFTNVNNLLLQGPGTTPAVYGSQVFIKAQFINIDGLLQSGRDSYDLTLGTNTVNEINGLGAGNGLAVLTNSDVQSSNFIVRYDRGLHQIAVDDVFTRGGHIEIEGHVLNTANGKIKVLGGYPTINITNNTGIDLVTYRVDDSQPGDGVLLIIDKSKGSAFATLYGQTTPGGTVTKVEDDGSGPVANGDTSHYTPANGWRYGWSIGVETFDRYFYHHDISAWLGIDWLAADPTAVSWDTHEVLSAPHVLDDGPYYFNDTGLTDSYTFQKQDKTLSATMAILDNHVDSTWYGEKTYHNEIEYKSRNLHIFTHTIEADRPIDVQFIGAAQGSIDIASNAAVRLRGPVLNPSGTTTITAGTQIVQEGPEAIVSGQRVELNAGTGIGVGTALEVQAGAGGLYAHTNSGDITIDQKVGDMLVDQVVTDHDFLGSGGKVTLTAQGSILVATGHTGLVRGGAISLTGEQGGIGSFSHFLQLDAGTLPFDVLDVNAHGAVYLEETDGNLTVDSVVATGDAYITVDNGSVIDGNTNETRDTRTYNELKGGVWHDLQLTGTTGAATKITDAENALSAVRTQEYQTYWSYRLTQPDDPMSFTTTGTLGGGVKYYAIVSGNTVQLAATAADAMSGKVIDIDSTSATGTQHGLSTTGQSFDAHGGVNDVANSITILGHGYNEGDAVTYSKLGTADGIGLTEGVTYYIHKVGDNTIQLKNALDVVVNIAPTAAAATQALYKLKLFDKSSDVNNATDSINLGAGHGLHTGDVVYYSVGQGDTAIKTTTTSTLKDGGTYYVVIVDGNTIKLSATPGGPAFDLNATTAAMGTQQSLGAGVKMFNAQTDVTGGATDSIHMTGHGFADGAAVVYTRQGTTGDIGLADGETYYVKKTDNDNFQLLLHADDSTVVDLTAASTADSQAFYLAHSTQKVFTLATDVDSAANTITIAGHGLAANQAVIYHTNVFDPNFTIHLTDAEKHAYQTQLGYDAAAIAALEASRTEQYHTLNTQYGGFGDVNNPNFKYILTASEKATVDGSIHVFTEDELLHTISVGLLKDVTDTVPIIEAPNITAPNIVINTFKGVGRLAAPVVIDVSGGLHNLTDDERVALSAAERTDVQFLGTATVAPVDVNGLHTFHRTDGFNWDTSLFTHDTRIHVAGGVNATDIEKFYLVDTVSGADLTIQENLVDQDGVVLTISPEVNDPTNPTTQIKTLVIAQRDDVNITDPGTVDVTAHDSVYLGSEESINVHLITNDGSHGSDDIRIKSGQSLTNAGALSTSTNVIGGNTILEAAQGGIGTLARPFNLDLTPAGTITARAENDIELVEKNGNMNIESIFSATGEANLTTNAGSIVDALNTDFTKIAANHVKLLAQGGGIGEAGGPPDYLDIDVAGGGTIVADADNDIYVSETFGDMNVQHVKSNLGNVDLRAAISILDANNDILPDVIGNQIKLNALIGGIGVSGNDLDIDTGSSPTGYLTSSSLLSNTYIIETSGDLYLNTSSAGDGFTAFITAPDGSILNSLVSPQNVISGRTYLVAKQDVGSALHPLTTEVGNLEGKSILGSTWIVNTGALETGGVIDSGDPGVVAGGDITISADSPIDVIEDIVADNILLNAKDDSGDDHIIIHSGFKLETATYDFALHTLVESAGIIKLNAGDSFLLQTGAQILTLGQVLINGDFVTDDLGNILPGNADPGLGASIVVNGTINAPQITITTNNDADNVLIDVNYPTDSLTGHVTVLGGAGHDLITVNRLHTRASTVDIDGQGGTDDVVINAGGRSGRSNYIVNVFDTGAPDDGADTLTVNGTEVGDPNNASGADLFLVRRNFVAYLYPNTSVDHLFPDVERINYNENINGRLIVNGLSGNDSFYSDDNSSITTLDGGAGNDFFQIGQVFGNDRNPPQVAAGDEIATIFTTKGYLSRGITFPTVVYGGTGDDTFQVYSNQAELRLEGNAGDDTFIIRAFALADPLTGKVLKDLSTAAQTAALGGDGNDLIQYSVNAPTDIDGGSGFNRMVVLGTEFDDNFAISSDGIFGAGLHITYANIQSITVDGLEGNDNFFILGTPPGVAVNVVGGLGYDTFNVGGDVTLPIVSRDLEGLSGVINHQVTSTDPAYDNIPADGVPLHVATASTGQIVVQESSGSTVVSEQGATTDTFTYSLAAIPTADVYLTVSAARSPSEAAAGGADTVLVSVDGGATFQPAAVVKFAAGTAVGTTKTVIVKAIDDTAAEGDGLVMVSSSSRSADASFNHVAVRNVKAEVLDNDQPGLRMIETDGDTTVLEGALPQGITDSYTLALSQAPEAGKTVSVTLDPNDARLVLTSGDSRYDALTHTFAFSLADWLTPALVNVAATDDGIVENPTISQITHVIGGTDPSYASFFAVNPAPKLNVKVLDTDGAGVYVRQTDGSTLVVQGDPTGDTYSLRLTHAPTADVKISLVTDGQTLVSNFDGTDTRFTAAAGATPAFVTFSTTNWFNPFVVKVTANPAAPPPDPNQQLKFFPVQPHIVSTAIQGSLTIDGSVGPEDRSIKPAVKLPTELDVPLPNSVATTDDTGSVDTLNIFNDGSGANDVGTLTGNNLFLNGMGGNLHFVDGQGHAHDFTGGINYLNVETVDVMLGRGDDNLTINGTMASTDGTRGPLTIVHGGGGSDTITINGGGGASSPLVVFGDTSQDGSRYVGQSGHASVNALAFNNPGNDTIDARNDTQSVTIFGGAGNDTIWGSQAGDHLAGGSGNDTIHGQGGDDIIYGDDGFNVGTTTIIIPDPNQDSGTINRTLYNRVLVTVSAVPAPGVPTVPGVPDTHDTLTPGQDLIFGDGGNDIVFGDLGLVTQTVTETLLSTINVVKVESKSNASGANDTIYGGDNDDILIGGTGGDAIDGGDGKDLIFGDNVSLDRTTTLGNFTNPRFRALSGTQIYSTAEGTAGNLLITGTNFTDPRGNAAWADFQITIQDHTNTTAAGLYGNDYIAGGAGDDTVFGGLGDDVIQGDGSIDFVSNGGRVGAFRDGSNALVLNPSFDNLATDGNDYIEGGGGNDVVFGNLGQDDIIGGSSTLFSLGTSSTQRPDGSDLLFGGSGLSVRNDVGDTSAQGHANDADAIVGDNGNIYRLVGVNGVLGGGGGVGTFAGFLAFNYDNYTNGLPAVQQAKIVVRGIQLVDYTPGGPSYVNQAGPLVTGDIGAGDEIHGDGGDDFIYGGAGNDVLFGDAQNDSIIGGYGNDWISGGNGDDGILGDDGRIFASRNSTSFGEPLYGIAAIPANQINLLDQTNNTVQMAILNVDGQLKYTADLTPDNLDPNHTATPSTLMPRALFANDIIFGGLGTDSIHGGAGEDAISGAEALAGDTVASRAYTNNYDQNGVKLNATPIESDYAHPFNPGNALGYNPATTKFALYDANDALSKIFLSATGALQKGSGLEWFLNFNDAEGPLDTKWFVGTGYAAKPTDGDDHVFGDLGHDWLVGGTGRDSLWGGWGDDVLNMDDVLSTASNTNASTDTNPSWEDMAYGGGGRDVLILNTNGDRAIDWVGEFNSYWTPFSAFGQVSVMRLQQPDLRTYLLALSKSQGADPTLAQHYASDPTRNGEPFGETGMIEQQDAAAHDQTGGPRDPQAGNGKAKSDINKTTNVSPLYETVAGPAAAATAPAVLITDVELVPIVAEARAAWTQALGADDSHLAALDNVQVSVGNLPDDRLGVTLGSQILIDSNAAGRGWFVQGTSQALAASGRMDLFTVVAHELGNAMGFPEDARETAAVTSPLLQAGERHTPGAPGTETGSLLESMITRIEARPAAAQTPAAQPVIDWDGRAELGARVSGREMAMTSAWLTDFLVVDSRARADVTSPSMFATERGDTFEPTSGKQAILRWDVESDVKGELLALAAVDTSTEL